MVSFYMEHKIVGLCTQCNEPALDDCQLCQRHRDLHRAANRTSMAKRRRDRRRAKQCIDCSAKLRAGSLCLACRVKRNRIRELASGVDRSVDKASAIAARTITHDDGRTRFHGQSRTGPQSRGQLDDQDMTYAQRYLDAGRDGLTLARAPEHAELPKVQRDDAVAAACAQIELAMRFFEAILTRNRYGGRKPNSGDF